MSPLTASLLITLLGMSLVFAAILVLWGLMALLVRLAADSPAGGSAGRRAELRSRAAALAVAAALADHELQTRTTPRAFPLPPTAMVSAWQAVRRANQLQQRGPVR